MDTTTAHSLLPALRGLLFHNGRFPRLRRLEDPMPDAVALPVAADTDESARIDAMRTALTTAGIPQTLPPALNLGDFGPVAVEDTTSRTGRCAGRVALVTGAAQGFGYEIAEALAAEGAFVALADVNAVGARDAAEKINRDNPARGAMGLAMDVADPASVQTAVTAIVNAYGGIDLLIANAGVLRAGSVKTQPLADFEFVQRVNYTGYFVCVQAVAPIMAARHRAQPGPWSDIIQINSKSGLAGSNRNGAYAGSKFGGIGLTQSFALELVEDGIKVNAICPGNFFDGPLWSDPDNGLFVQYLRTGKVPGAHTIEAVRRFYEDKVPMRRGCTTPDVMRAIFYLTEQAYETGQALPVTGGQVMLS